MLSIKNLSSSDLEIIQEHLVRKRLKRGEVLAQENIKGQSMFFVESGALKLVRRSANDSRDDVVLSVYKPGSFCFEEAVLSENSVNSGTLVAIEDASVLELTRDSVHQLMVQSMPTGTKLLLGISRNYRDAVTFHNNKSKIITFVSPKDGVGKTTLMMNLAMDLGRKGRKIIVIDADLQLGNANLHLGLPAKPNVARLIQFEENLTFERISKFFISSQHIRLLAAPELPQEADLITRTQMNQIARECSKNCDYLFIDASSFIEEISISMWDIADSLYFVTCGDISSTTRLKRLAKAISRLNYPKSKIHGIVNKYHSEQSDYLQACQDALEGEWFTTSFDNKAAYDAIMNASPIAFQAPDSRLTQDMAKILKHITGEERLRLERGGVFGWLGSLLKL